MTNFGLVSGFKFRVSSFGTAFRILKNFQPFNLSILFTFLILNSSYLICFSQDSLDGHLMTIEEKKEFCESATIWRGFFHQWNYNHRTNRIGDYIVQDNSVCNNGTNIIHTGASGSGKDNLEFTSFYTQVKTTSAHFYMDAVEFEMKGDEGEILNKTITIPKKEAEELKGFSKYYILLNGFDLYSISTTGSDKMFKLAISPENLKVDSATGDYTFDLNVAFGADCNSMECNFKAKNQYFSYNFTVAYIIIGGNEGLSVSSDSLQNHYTWNRVTEIFKEDKGNKSSVVTARNNKQYFPFAVMGVKSFDLFVQSGIHIRDEATHMLTLDLSIHPEGYEPKNNSFYYRSCLFFKPWTHNMRMLANRSSGSADFKMNVCMLQFADEDASIKHLEYSDRYRWKTRILKQTPPTNPNAVKKYSISYGE